jgi:hypothetical protein
MSLKTPEERAVIARKLAIVAGMVPVSEIGIGEFKVRKAAIEKPVKAHLSLSNNNDNEDRVEIGRKLAMTAGMVPIDSGRYSRSEIPRVIIFP